MAFSSSEDDERQPLYRRAVSTVLVPVNAATSRSAIKAYLSTILFLAFSLFLLAISTTAYTLFYYSYVPQLGLEETLHLQYGDSQYPYATTRLPSGTLTSQQPYDVSLELHLPRTPNNMAAGNFMLDLSLLSRPSSTTSAPGLSAILPNSSSILAHSRRPAILPYQSTLLSIVHDVVALPWHTLGLKDLDADTLSISMFELMSFPRGSRSVPGAVKVEIQSPQALQIYSAKIIFHARFEGLRYILYNYRILSFLVFTSCFYTVSLTSTSIAWLVISSLLRPASSSSTPPKKEANDEGKKIKHEEGEGEGDAPVSNGTIAKREPQHSDHSSDETGLSVSNISDNATTFPTLGRQMPLRFPVQRPGDGAATTGSRTIPPRTDIKREPLEDERHAIMETPALDSLAPQTNPSEAADDEEDLDDEGRGRDRGDAARDSGIGTSMESEGARDSALGLGLQRRRSRVSGQSTPR